MPPGATASHWQLSAKAENSDAGQFTRPDCLLSEGFAISGRFRNRLCSTAAGHSQSLSKFALQLQLVWQQQGAYGPLDRYQT